MKFNFHTKVSLLKSAARIVAGIALILGDVITAGMVLIGAEVFGIIEEL